MERKRKKLSPSQLGRNQKRKEDFLKKKSENSTSEKSILHEESEPETTFKSSLCDKVFIPLCTELHFGVFLNTEMCCFGAERLKFNKKNSSMQSVQFWLPGKNRTLFDGGSGNWPSEGESH